MKDRMLYLKEMLLAGENKENEVKLLEVKFSKPGDQVLPEGYTGGTDQITINDFAKLKMKVINKEPFFNKKLLKTSTEKVTCDMTNGEIH